jgi:5-methylcytosine-specific restriction protein A
MADYKESDPFYHSKEWKRVRADALQRDFGMCQDCMDKFRAGIIRKPRRAVMVHHVIPRSERPDLELVMDNLRSLCRGCHEARHPERRSRKKRKTLERIRTHKMRVIKV